MASRFSDEYIRQNPVRSFAWWRHQMETFSALLAICAGNSPVPGEFHAQRPVTRSFDVFFDLPPNKRLSKQWWGWWFETSSSPLWRHCNGEQNNCLLHESLLLPWCEACIESNSFYFHIDNNHNSQFSISGELTTSLKMATMISCDLIARSP